ncbi:3678_t:CDS:10, partial [Racocetra persica]
ASKISNNELARLMATLYQENKKQLYLIKEEIIKNELELKKAREENKLYKNLEIENEGIKKRLRELPKIINGEGEKEPSNQTVPVTPLVPPTPTTLVEENYQSELTARQEAERARDENLVIINSAQKYLESDGLIDEETGLDIFDENENGCLIVNQDKVNAYKEAKIAANFGDEIQQQLIAKISSDCKLTTEEESTELAVEELISRIQKLIEEGRDLTQQLDQEKSTNANLQDQINQLTQDKNNFQNQLAEAKKAEKNKVLNISIMTNAQEWLNANIPLNQRVNLRKLLICSAARQREQNLGHEFGHLYEHITDRYYLETSLTGTMDLSTFPHLEEIIVEAPALEEIFLRNNNFRQQNLSSFTRFTQLKRLFLGTDDSRTQAGVNDLKAEIEEYLELEAAVEKSQATPETPAAEKSLSEPTPAVDQSPETNQDSELESLKKQVAKLENDKLLLAAELKNAQNNFQRQMEQVYKYSNKRLVSWVLAFLVDLEEKALESKPISNKIIGIDLGTTNSCVAVIDGKEQRVLENPQGDRITPSVQRIIIGKNAKGQAEVNPEVITSIKSVMGQRVKKTLGGKDYTPEQISAEILRYLVSYAEDKLGKKITRAVITVPAYFNDSQRQATKDAGKIAGLTVERIINEPTAAALAYGLDKAEREQTIFVYDLGGGTFDVSILQISKSGEGDIFETIATAGIKDLGGDDFDQKIVDYVVQEVKKERKIDLLSEGETENDRKIIKQRLREEAEKAKKTLSSSLEATISLPYIIPPTGGRSPHVEVKITRAKFEALTKDYMERTMKQVDQAIQAAEKKLGRSLAIDQIILVGGSTRMPMVETLLETKFGQKKINKTVNPDEVVAVGAAIQGAVLAGDFGRDIVLSDVTSLSLGIAVQGARGEGEVNDIIIPRNTTIPTSATRIYSTAEDNQPSVHIRPLQGERPRAVDNKVLGSFELSGIEPAPRGVPQIEVAFNIDANGIVNVTAQDKKTGKKAEITIRDSQNLSEAEIQRMSNTELLNKGETYCYTFEKQVEEFKKHKNFREDDASFQRFQELLSALKKAVEEKNYPELQKQLKQVEELMKLANELSQKMPKQAEGEKKEEEVYYVLNEPTVADKVYDQYFHELEQLERENNFTFPDSPTQKIGFLGGKKLRLVTRPNPMLSLDSVDNYEDLLRFDERVKKILKTEAEIEYVCEWKIDGLSVSLLYRNSELTQISTRGNGMVGEDVTFNKELLKNVPFSLSQVNECEVRGEICMKKAEFFRLNQELQKNHGKLLANPRNAASGSLRTLLPLQNRNLHFFAYQLFNDNLPNQLSCLQQLEKLGFAVSPDYHRCQNIHEVAKFITSQQKKREALDFESDGVVVKVNDYKYYEKLGQTSRFPLSRSGRITYVAEITPVNLRGSQINKATLHNYAFIRNLALNIGDEVVIKKAGDVIPQVSQVNCPQKVINFLTHFASKIGLDIKGVSEKIIAKLYQKNLLQKPTDFYQLKNKEPELLQLEGFQKKMLSNIFRAVENSKKKPLASLLTALGIPLLSSVKAQKLT